MVGQMSVVVDSDGIVRLLIEYVFRMAMAHLAAIILVHRLG